MSEIVLSIGMIVKDEIRCLEKCLRALEPLRKAVPSELVIADTGSTDGTREIAARYADIFFDIPWQNDFSAARNAVLARCSGQWYFSIDADEYLDEHIENLVQFLMVPPEQGWNADYALITISNYADQTLDKETASSFLALRLARIRPGLTYVGKIHERFERTGDEILLNIPAVVLWHDGYAYETPEQARKKTKRNMQLLKEALEKNPDEPICIVQCIESSQNAEEQLEYIARGLKLILSDAPGWEQQGASLMRYAIKLAVNIGSSRLQEWLRIAQERYPNSPLIQIDINALMAYYYEKCLQWKDLLKVADAYWEGVQKLDRGEYPPEIFAAVLLESDKQSVREYMALLQAEACWHLERPNLAVQVLQKVPLRTIGSSHVAGLIGMLAKLSQKTNVAKLFCTDARHILKDEPTSQESWRRRDALQKALNSLFEATDEEYPLPIPLLLQLKDDVFAPAAAMMAAEDKGELKKIAESVVDWKHIPTTVIQKLIAAEIPLPDALFQTMDFDDICHTADYLVKQGNTTERLLQFVGELDPANVRMAVWRFELTAQSCAWFKWKNVNLASRLYDVFCTSAERFLAMSYPAELLQAEYADAVLPQNCRFACRCLEMERHFRDGDYLACIHLLKEMLKLEPSMREMLLFLTDRVEHTVETQRIKERVTPDMIAMAKQIRTILTQYSEDDPAVFVLKNSEQYQKMKFLIEDPDLDTL